MSAQMDGTAKADAQIVNKFAASQQMQGAAGKADFAVTPMGTMNESIQQNLHESSKNIQNNLKQMASALNQGSTNEEANYIYNSSGAISVNVNENYWDQAIAGGKAGEQKQAKLELPNVVFFGPFKKLLQVGDLFNSGSQLREPKEKPASGNFFDQPGKTIDGKNIGKMR